MDLKVKQDETTLQAALTRLAVSAAEKTTAILETVEGLLFLKVSNVKIRKKESLNTTVKIPSTSNFKKCWKS